MSDNTNESNAERRATHVDPAVPTRVVPPLTPPAGWYPDPQDPGIQRYWDGAQWTVHTNSGATGGPAAAVGVGVGVVAERAAVGAARGARVPRGAGDAAGGGAAAVSTKRGLPALKWWQWALVALAVVVLVSIAIGGANSGRSSGAAPKPPTAYESDAAESVVEEEPVVEMVEVPNVVGATVAEARASLETVGITMVPNEAGDDWIVTTQVPAHGSHPTEGLAFSITAEAPKPVYTLAQQNAIAKAQSYLSFMGFSRTGLVKQLEFEGFSTDDATFGADNAGADWNAEAAEKAKSYLDMMSFSREGLYDQLAYEGFGDAEIQYGLAAVGY